VPSRNRLHGTVNGLRALPRRGIACFVGPNASDNLMRAITDDLAEFGRDLIGTATKSQEGTLHQHKQGLFPALLAAARAFARKP